jgi:L-amino acid N-acyltransferase YncA
MTYTIQLADADHVHQIVAIVNQEAQRSTATAAFVDEPVDRWITSYLNTHHKLPWLVAIDGKRAIGDRVIAFAKGSYYNAREGFQWSVELSVKLIVIIVRCK